MSSQMYFDFGQGRRRYCNTHRDWVKDEVTCFPHCCTGWKRIQSLTITVESTEKEVKD